MQPPTAADWKHLAAHVDGTLARPGSSTYNTVRLTQNPRYDGARPLAVLSVANARDVATAFSFAQDHGVRVAIRSGGHSYPGWSAGDGALVVDVRPLDHVSLSGTTATVGAGASLVQVYDALGTRGRGIAGGSCPTVGIAGLTQGGGVGVLTRAYGLTCDSVTGMNVVLGNGTMDRAAHDDNGDLFWALRGGGGGHLGAVTSFTFKTFAAPTITRAYIAWPFSAAAEVVPRWLETIPSADPRLWATLKLLGGPSHPSRPALFMSATWTGPASSMDAALKPLLSKVPAPTTDSRSTASYLDTMLTYAGCSSIPVSECHTGPGGSLDREAFAATSHMIKSPHVDMKALLDRVRRRTGHRAQGGWHLHRRPGRRCERHRWQRHGVRPPRRPGHRPVHRDIHLGSGHRRHVVRPGLPHGDDPELGHRSVRQLRRRLPDQLHAGLLRGERSQPHADPRVVRLRRLLHSAAGL